MIIDFKGQDIAVFTLLSALANELIKSLIANGEHKMRAAEIVEEAAARGVHGALCKNPNKEVHDERK